MHPLPGAVDLLSLGFPHRGRHLADQIVRASSVLTDHPGELVKAYDRVRLARPPATKAKQSIKDCLIAESYLHLAATPRTGGFSRNMVFATSNTRDYQQDHTSLHPVPRPDFDSACLEYSPTWSAARHELDRCRTQMPAPNPAWLLTHPIPFPAFPSEEAGRQPRPGNSTRAKTGRAEVHEYIQPPNDLTLTVGVLSA